jgi:thymidylate synthase
MLDSSIRDVSCACTLQFLVREGRLHAIAYMRSNDAIWGLPYDVFLFSMLQELLATELGLPLGSYYHFAGSLHLYEYHFALARELIEAPKPEPFEMPPMTAPQQSSELIKAEVETRKHGTASAELLATLDPYWADLIRVLQAFRCGKHSDNEGVVEQAFQFNPYARLLRDGRKHGRS